GSFTVRYRKKFAMPYKSSSLKCIKVPRVGTFWRMREFFGSSESPTKTTIPFVKWNVSPRWSSGEMGAKGSNGVVRRVRPASENDATIPHLHSLEARVSRVMPPRLVRNRRERSGVPEPNPAQGVQCQFVRRQRSRSVDRYKLRSFASRHPRA